MSRLRMGDDGSSAFARRTERLWKQPLILFGERCFFRPFPSQSETNLDRSTFKPRLEYGRYIGTRHRNNDMLFMTTKGFRGGTAFHRRTIGERWTHEDWDALSGTPWNMRPRAGPGEVEHSIPIQAPAVPVTPEMDNRAYASRTFYIKKQDLTELGFMPGCPGCDSSRLGGPPRNHIQACRD